MEEVLLEGGCDGGFSAGGEAGEPDCEALLFAVCVALLAGKTLVPGDVADWCEYGYAGTFVWDSGVAEGLFGTYVAILMLSLRIQMGKFEVNVEKRV